MMEIFQKTSFVLYGVALAVSLLGFLLNKNWKFRYALFALVVGWVFNTLYIIVRWHLAGRAPLSNQYESLIFLVWTFIAVYLLFRLFSGFMLEWLAPWVALVAIIGIGASSFLDTTISPLVPALQSNWLLIHVSTVMAGYGALTLAFVLSIIFLFIPLPASGQKKPIKLKQLGNKIEDVTSYESKRISLNQIIFRSCLIGFWLLTIGIITGAVWANSAWGSYWSWDPKETWSLITWLYYAVAIHLRRTKNWKDKKFAMLMLWGFVLVMFTYFGVNYLLSGLHSYG